MAEGGDIFISVTAPVFNESEVLVAVLKEWISILEGLGHRWEIVLADDGSTDGSSEKALSIGEPRIKVLRFEKNRGYGHALSQALGASAGRYVVTIDSDGQFDLSEMPAMLEQLEREGLDLVTGRRRKKKDVFWKVLGDRVLNRMVRIIFGLDLGDTNCALKVIEAEAARNIRIEAMGFPTPTEVIVRASRLGLKIGEHPVTHRERSGGVSKLNTLRGAVDFLAFLVYLRLQIALENRRVIRKAAK